MIGIGVRQNRIGFGGVTPPTPFDNTYSLDFDGVDDYVDCGDFTAYDTGDLSVSIWIYTTTSDSTQYVFSNSGAGAKAGFDIVINDHDKVKFSRRTTTHDSSTGYDNIGFTINNWHHIVGTYDDTTQTIKIYLDGVLKETQTGSASSNSASGNLHIGSIGGGSWFTGNLDEPSIWNTALSSGDVSTLYNSGTPNNLNTALATTPLAWYRMGDSGTFFNSNWEIPEQSKLENWSSHSFDLDGTNDTINCGNDNSLDLVGHDFSVSFWINPDTTHNALLLERYLSGSGWGVYDNSGTLKFYDGAFKTFSPSISLTNGVWQHILITGITGTNTLSCYKDGGSAATAVLTAITSVTDNFIIGSQHGTGFYFNGKMDEVSIFDSIKAVADVNVGNKPIDISGESNLIGYWRMGEDATWDGSNWTIPDASTNSNTGTSANTAIDAKINNAPDNINQGLSDGMGETAPSGRSTDVP